MINKLNEYLDNNNEFSKLVDLINYSIKNESDNITILEKMLVISMVTKLEVFLENITSEWFENLKSDPAKTTHDLSETIKREIIKETISNVYDELKNGNISNRNKNKLSNFNILVDEYYPLNELDIQFRITLNSHGSNEIKSLLKKIGIDDIFGKMEQHFIEKDRGESLGDINLTTQVDYEGIINRLICSRNKIIHEDDFGNISYFDLNEFIESLNLLSVIVKENIDNSEYISS